MASIQWISLFKKNIEGVECTAISSPKALDSFEINIIDLSHSYVWRYDGKILGSVNCAQDLVNIQDMISNSKNKKVIILLPQEITYEYYYSGREYLKNVRIKNTLSTIVSVLFNDLGVPSFELGFENNTTVLGDKRLNSAFYFKNSKSEIITKAVDTNKVTTIKQDNYYVTTLDISNKTQLDNFLIQSKILLFKEPIPEWLENYSFNDDAELMEVKNEKTRQIELITKEVEQINDKLQENEYYKRILIESGDQLVEIVFKILDDIFNVNLFDFEDKKGPDFIFDYEKTTFIGEIKGINSNVKKSNVSQLDDHCSIYTDDKTEEEAKNVKGVLIINHQRLSPLSNRQPVADAEIQKALNNGLLIIESETLLKIFELFKKGEYSSDKIYQLFLTSGILKI